MRGASFTDMTETSRVAKRPVYLGAGGELILNAEKPTTLEYGDKAKAVAIGSVLKIQNGGLFPGQNGQGGALRGELLFC